MRGSEVVGDAADRVFGGRGQGHLLGQARLGPARLAHCMRWLGQAETALDMMVDRATQRFAHGSLLSEKQGIQWMIADSAMELYQAKLMVLHAAYLIDKKADFKDEATVHKYLVAQTGGAPVRIRKYDPTAGNQYLIMLDHQVY